MASLGESQDVQDHTKSPGALPDIAALPRETDPSRMRSVQQLSDRLHPVGDFLAAPFSELPPAPKGRWARLAFILVAVLALAFVVYFTAYTWSLFDALRSNAEDMGIMDQAIWNTLHGALLHQTICNNIGDTNCIGDVSRFAIHFEPLMLPISLLYLIAPSPKTLMLFQALVVASGAFPVYWIASRRLASPLAGLGFATGYLLYPALQSAVLFDFHAVTLAAAFLMFAIYFMLTRNNVGLIIACLLALSTKEEIPIDIIMIALAIMVFQRRYKLGLGLIGLGVGWLAVTLVVMHVFSPLGHSPTASRYGYLGGSPLEVVRTMVTHPVSVFRDQILNHNALHNIHMLIGPLGYYGVLGPSALILAIPAILLNLLSSDPHMQLGVHQYSAEIVPFMVFAAISGMTFLVGLITLLARRGPSRVASVFSPTGERANDIVLRLPAGGYRTRHQVVAGLVIFLFLALMGFFSLAQQSLGDLPGTYNFVWPTQTAHTRLFHQVAALIPANASVSAQDTLVPHLSHRRYIYQYPYMAEQSSYVVLDSQAGIYPFAMTPQGLNDYSQSVEDLLHSGKFRVIFQQDGYMVLQRIT
jgi:uncharacterized membrane protein